MAEGPSPRRPYEYGRDGFEVDDWVERRMSRLPRWGRVVVAVVVIAASLAVVYGMLTLARGLLH